MIDTILFDLDGTLLPMDYDQFMNLYFYHIGDHFKDKIDPKLLAKYIMDSTKQVVMNTTGESNEDTFMNHFETLINGDINEFKDGFLEFYKTKFKHVQPSTYKSEKMRLSVDILKDKGYKVVIATNPIFPMVANIERIKWAGFTPDEFAYISCFEDSFYTKPHKEYFQGVMDKVGKTANQCLMVGNDLFDDLGAKKLGVQTYIINDHLVNHHQLENTSDFEGSYQDFYGFVKQLPKLK